MARLSVGHVTQGFGSLTVLDDVSLTVESGRVACLLGPSGCGKTTPFHVVAGLERPSAGRVLLGERDVTGCPGQLSSMLQKDLLLPSKTILDNVSLPLVLRGTPRDAAREEARELMPTFGLVGTEDRWPAELSGGMRQRTPGGRAHVHRRRGAHRSAAQRAPRLQPDRGLPCA